MKTQIKKKNSIPAACKLLNVKCIQFIELLRNEKLKF